MKYSRNSNYVALMLLLMVLLEVHICVVFHKSSLTQGKVKNLSTTKWFYSKVFKLDGGGFNTNGQEMTEYTLDLDIPANLEILEINFRTGTMLMYNQRYYVVNMYFDGELVDRFHHAAHYYYYSYWTDQTGQLNAIIKNVSAGKHKLHFAVESNQGYLHYYYVNYPEGCPVNVQMVGYIKKHVHK